MMQAKLKDLPVIVHRTMPQAKLPTGSCLLLIAATSLGLWVTVAHIVAAIL